MRRILLFVAVVAVAVAAYVVVEAWPRPIRPGPEIVGALPDTLQIPPCPERRVSTPEELVQVLLSEFQGCVVVTRDSVLDMTLLFEIPIPSGVHLMGERGELGSRPLIFTDAKCVRRQSDPCTAYSLFTITGNNTSVTALHFRGPAKGNRVNNEQNPYVHAIEITADPDAQLGRNIHIAENEFEEWPGAGVEIRSTHRALKPEDYDAMWSTRLTRDDARLLRVERNFFHHNARDGGGYGVVVGGGAYATIWGNVFDFNRHAVASDGRAHTGYIARFNYVLSGGFKQGSYYNQHFDVHGTALDDEGGNTGYGATAGEYYEIAHNAIHGAQGYSCFIVCLKTRPALMLRGKSTIETRFDANVAVHDDLDAAVSLKMEKGDTGFGEHHEDFNFDAAGNHFDTSHSNEIAAGDFDGDGRTDVFVSTGTAWFYSRGGQGGWEYLHASNKLARELGFADIDNDGVTDVLYRDGGGNLGFLKSGRVSLQPLTTTPEPMPNLRFGDFDGDALTDIFFTRDQQWQVWHGSTKAWTPTQTSSIAIADLLFGEFDRVKGTDVAAITGGRWQISSGSTGSWRPLNDRLRSSFRGAVAADFDGDGRTDIAFDDKCQKWSFSSGGSGPMQTLRQGEKGRAYPRLNRLIVGRFDGDPSAEVVSYEFTPIIFGGRYDGCNIFPWDSRPRPTHPNNFMVWRGGRDVPLEQLSLHAMR